MLKGQQPLAFFYIVSLSLAAMFIGAWELCVTRLASVVYFYDLTYLALAVCLFGLSLGALLTRRIAQHLAGPSTVCVLLVLILAMLPPAWTLLSRFDLAWVFGVFAWPFVLLGAASTLAWQRIEGASQRRALYVGEMLGAVIGLIILGPMSVARLPIDVFGSIGIQTHLRTTVAEEKLTAHRHATTAYARTDLIFTERSSVAYLFTDAMFVTRSVQWDGVSKNFGDPHVEDLARLKRLSLLGAKRGRVLLLGAGAGFDITVALQEGAAHIDAVEVNPQTIAFARSMEVRAGHPLDNAKVNLHIAEARRFVQTSSERWDHINLTLLQTSPAAGRGRSHVDARVLTVEAIQSYLAHLAPLGIVAVIQNSANLTERSYQAILAANGHRPERIVGFKLPDRKNNPFSYLLITRNEAFTNDSLMALQATATSFNATPLTFPNNDGDRPATDDRPFLFEPGTRIATHALLAGALTLLIILIVLSRERHTAGNVRLGSAAILAGVATMALQVIVVYRVQTALGNPALAMSVALAAVLGGAALGALFFGRATLTWRTSGIAALVGVGLFAVSAATIADYCATLHLSDSLLVITGFTVLCSLPIGLPFLKLMQSSRRNQGEGLVIGCDGLGGIVGAAIATGTAMTMGFNAVGIVLILAFTGFVLLAPAEQY
jgi:spermidine synthase